MSDLKKDHETLGLQAQREKYWGELSIEEKIERMRGVIKSQGSVMQALYQLERNFSQHQHSASGQIMLPFDRYISGGVNVGEAKNISSDPNQVYF